jgi:hypothetical protein
MARPQAKDGKAATDGNPRPDKAAQVEAQIRAFHALGQAVIARVGGTGDIDATTLADLMKKTGEGRDNIRKARVFARVYKSEELDVLCRLRTPQGLPLSWRLVRQLLTVPPGKDREALQRKAAELGWSLEELTDAIPQKVRRQQRSREGGRAFRRPRTVVAGLRQVVRHGEEWLRRYRKSWSEDAWLEGRPGAAGPGGLKARLAEARETLRKLQEAAGALDDKLKRIEAKQGDGR